jgi:hypothetical protein
MNDMQKRALQYVKNTNGGATKAIFIEDHDPIGRTLWADLDGMIREDENGRIWLTEAGDAALAA